MVRGLYTAATGLQTQREKFDVVSNNIANIETTGYKQDDLLSKSFEDLLFYRSTDYSMGEDNKVGFLNQGTHIDQIYTDFSNGSYEETGIKTNLAIKGNGFFVVSTPKGERYTQDGSFQLDSNGNLCTSEGYFVQGTNGNINLSSDNFTVGENGLITIDGVAAGQIRLVSFDENAVMKKEGSNLYATDSNPVNSEASLLQGYLESSNVNLIDEMTEMIQISRAFETNQKIINIIDGTMDLAANEIGKL